MNKEVENLIPKFGTIYDKIDFNGFRVCQDAKFGIAKRYSRFNHSCNNNADSY